MVSHPDPFFARLPSNPNILSAGKVKPVIDSVHKFDDVLSAYDRILTGHARGKVVVEVA